MKVNFEKEDLCLVAVPSYGGRIPSSVTDMFCNVKADGTKVRRVGTSQKGYWELAQWYQ